MIIVLIVGGMMLKMMLMIFINIKRMGHAECVCVLRKENLHARAEDLRWHGHCFLSK